MIPKRLWVMAVVILMLASILTGTVQAENGPSIEITDDDMDKIYFSGDDLEFAISGLGSLEKIWVSFYVVWGNEPEDSEELAVIDGLTFEDDLYIIEVDVVDGVGVVSGKIQEDLPTGAIAVRLRMEEEGSWQNLGPLFRVVGEDVFIAVVGFPWQFGDVSSNLNEMQNLYDTEVPVIFTKEGMGSIAFAPGLNFIDSYEQMEGLEEFLTIEYDGETNTVTASVTTSQLEFLNGVEATIRFFSIAEKLGLKDMTADNFREHMFITVYDEDGESVADASEYFDWNAASYDADADILELPVNHFTDYVVGGMGEMDEEPTTPETGTAIMLLIPFGLLLMLAGAFVIRKRVLA